LIVLVSSPAHLLENVTLTSILSLSEGEEEWLEEVLSIFLLGVVNPDVGFFGKAFHLYLTWKRVKGV